MTQLVALLSSGKGTWTDVAKLTNHFDETVLITNKFGAENYSSQGTTQMVLCDLDAPVHALEDQFVKQLRPLLKGGDVAVNMVSGSGNEHMALISALLKLGLGIRLVVSNDHGFDEL